MADNDDLVKEDNDAEDNGFLGGFDNPTEKTPLEAPKPEEGEIDPKPAADDAPKDDEPKDPLDPVDPPPPPAPEFVQLTKEQFDRLNALADKTATFESQLNKAFGTIGGMKQIVDQLQASTPKGEAVEIPADAFTEMEAEYPDLAKQMRSALEKTLKNTRGTGDAKAVVDPEKVTQMVADGIRQREMETLEDTYPDWKEIVGAVDSKDKADPNNAFRKWLSAEPADYQQKVNATHSASVLSRAIDRFKEAAKMPPPAPPPPKDPAPKQAIRRDRIKDAIQPKGDGNTPPPKKTDDDAFEEGFQTG